jgi:hypothetical protein
VGTLLSAISPIVAQAGRVKIIVLDSAKATISKVEVALIGADDKPVRKQITDEHGVSRWADLPMGDTKFRLSFLGFTAKTMTVVIKGSDELSLEIVLEADPTIDVFVTEAAPLLETKQ